MLFGNISGFIQHTLGIPFLIDMSTVFQSLVLRVVFITVPSSL